MRIRTGIILFLLAGGTLLGGAAYAWSLGTPAPRVIPQATVSVDTGEAWIQKGGVGEWLPVAADTPIAAGDHVRTGEHAKAHVTFFDTETARLDENAELVINAADVDPDNIGKHNVSIRVLGGRVWSRIIKFTDRESSYTAHMSDVVATVRGTAFVMNAADPKGWLVHVVDSAVDVRLGADASTTQRIAAGDEAWVPKVAATATLAIPVQMERRTMDPARMEDAWFEDNERSDAEFLDAMRLRRVKVLEKEIRVLPGSFRYRIKLLGEQLRIALTADGEARRDLVGRILSERLYEQLLAPQAGGGNATVKWLLTRMKPDSSMVEKTARWCKRTRRVLGEYALTVRVLEAAETPGDVKFSDPLVWLQTEHDQVCPRNEATHVPTAASVPVVENAPVVETNTNTPPTDSTFTAQPVTNTSSHGNATVPSVTSGNTNTPPATGTGVPIFFPPQQPTVNQPAAPSNTNTANTTNTNTNTHTPTNQNLNSNQNTNTNTPTSQNLNTNQNTNTTRTPTGNSNTNTNTSPSTTAPTTTTNTNTAPATTSGPTSFNPAPTGNTNTNAPTLLLNPASASLINVNSSKTSASRGS